MNKVLLTISALLIAVSSAFEINYLDYEEPIEHKDHDKISLKDFKGLKRINDNLYGGSEFAYIVTEIRIFENQHSYVIKALFHPSRSYVYNDNSLGDKSLLTHEMYHFHITEYIARKLRRDLHKHRKEDVNLDELYEKYINEERLLQQQYDKDTYHSYFFGKQIEWQHKIDSLLITLNNYR